LCLALVAILAMAQAMQVATTADLAAMAAIEADADMHPLTAKDVVTAADFSKEEYEGLQALTNTEFWDKLEQELLESSAVTAPEQALIEKPAEKKKEAKKGDKKAKKDGKKGKKDGKKDGKKGKKAGKKNKKFSFKTDKDIKELAKLAVPAENEKPALKDAEFEKDTPYEFVQLEGLSKPPEKTDAFLVKAEFTRKALLKKLAKRGQKYMKILKKLRKAAKKNIKEKEWDVVKKIAKRTEEFENKLENWLTQRDAAFLLRDALIQADGWREQYRDFVEAINKKYVEDRKKLVKKIRAEFDKYRIAKQQDKMLHMKEEALRAFKTDLENLKGDAMKTFVKKYKQALYKKFGKAKIDKALRKDAKRRAKMLARKKAGKPVKKGPCENLSYLKRATKGQATSILVRVAAHLPTVGPYIRAGVVSDEAGKAAAPIIRRW